MLDLIELYVWAHWELILPGRISAVPWASYPCQHPGCWAQPEPPKTGHGNEVGGQRVFAVNFLCPISLWSITQSCLCISMHRPEEAAEMRFRILMQMPSSGPGCVLQTLMACACSILIWSTGIPRGLWFFLFETSSFYFTYSLQNTSCRVLAKPTWAEDFSLQWHDLVWQPWVWGGAGSVTPMAALKSWRKTWALWLKISLNLKSLSTCLKSIQYQFFQDLNLILCAYSLGSKTTSLMTVFGVSHGYLRVMSLYWRFPLGMLHHFILGKQQQKTWFHFKFSMQAYFRTFEVFIIKFISISKCFLFFFAKISWCLIFFHRRREPKALVKQISSDTNTM